MVNLGDPVGVVMEETVRPNGMEIQKVRVPIGVIIIIYESRPNVTADAASLCLKTGNATILRGGKESIHSNIAIYRQISSALENTGLDKIIKFRDDEIHHKNIAYEEGATKKGLYSIMDKIIKTGSKIAINISEKI